MTQKIKFINKKKFVVAVLNTDSVIFIIYIAALDIKCTNTAIHFFWVAQIRLLKANKMPIIIFTKSFNYTNIFSLKFAIELSEYTSINNLTIKLEKGK